MAIAACSSYIVYVCGSEFLDDIVVAYVSCTIQGLDTSVTESYSSSDGFCHLQVTDIAKVLENLQEGKKKNSN